MEEKRQIHLFVFQPLIFLVLLLLPLISSFPCCPFNPFLFLPPYFSSLYVILHLYLLVVSRSPPPPLSLFHFFFIHPPLFLLPFYFSFPNSSSVFLLLLDSFTCLFPSCHHLPVFLFLFIFIPPSPPF